MRERSYTRIDDDIVVCDDCGAHAASHDRIRHHATCRPGESKRWEQHYNAAEREDVARTIGEHVIKQAPKGATGIYITSRGVAYGFRTNSAKFPQNFVPFQP